MKKTQKRDEMKNEIKAKYAGLFDKLAKEEMERGTIYNYGKIKVWMDTMKFASTARVQVILSNQESEGKNYYQEQTI